MLIVWKWKDFKSNIVTEELLAKDGYDPASFRIAEVKDRLFDEFRAANLSNSSNDFKLTEPESIIVRLRMKRQPGDKLTTDFLLKLIEYYAQKDTRLFVFLHRKDGYADTIIEFLINRYKNHRYFLFGGGRDYLYYRVRNEGLLGENGRFEFKMANRKAPAIRVANTKHKVVFQPHFDKVWRYYEHEFYSKIYELKEDVLRYFFDLIAAQFDQPSKKYLDYLNKRPPLLWRIKSFMDQGGSFLSEAEKEQLEEYGRRQQKSYIFDDCRANLANIIQIEEEYDSVVNLLIELLFEPLRGKTLRHVLKQLNEKFEELLKAIGHNYSVDAKDSVYI